MATGFGSETARTVHEASPGANTSKCNFSDLTSLTLLQNTCKRKVIWNHVTAQSTHGDAFECLWTRECTMENFCCWWISLWGNEKCTLPKVPIVLNPLVQHMNGLYYNGQEPFKNEAGKTTFFLLGCIAGYVNPDIPWTVRISTTNNPVTDWCGLKAICSHSCPEKNLNGRCIPTTYYSCVAKWFCVLSCVAPSLADHSFVIIARYINFLFW